MSSFYVCQRQNHAPTPMPILSKLQHLPQGSCLIPRQTIGKLAGFREKPPGSIRESRNRRRRNRVLDACQVATKGCSAMRRKPSRAKLFRARGSLSRAKAPIYNEGEKMTDGAARGPRHQQQPTCKKKTMMAIPPSSSLPPAPLTVMYLVPTPRRVPSRRPAILFRGGQPILFLSLAATPRPEEDGDTVASYIYTVSRKFGLVYFPSYSVQFLGRRGGPC